MRLVEDLQSGFALNQPLSPFALAAFEVLDPDVADLRARRGLGHRGDLDDPRPVLLAQQFKARGEAVAEMKAEGIEYDERMELLEDVTWPKPLQELLEAVFETYRGGAPVGRGDAAVAEVGGARHVRAGDDVRRVRRLLRAVARSEGLVLRYLSDAYKALRQTVPDAAKTEELDDLIEWLGEVVRQTDSSLLDEWEPLSDPSRRPSTRAPAPRRWRLA